MSKDAIMKIKAAEDQARGIRESAAEEAKRRIQSTELRGKQFCTETERRATEENEKKLALIREKAEQTILKNREATLSASQDAMDEANLHMREAIRYIIGGIMEECQ